MKEKILKYIKQEEDKCYYNGIPDKAPLRLEQLNKVPSYRKICSAIIKNDYSLKSLGFNKKKSLMYDAFKKIEFKQKGKVMEPKKTQKRIEIDVFKDQLKDLDYSQLNSEAINIAFNLMSVNPNTWQSELKVNRKHSACLELMHEIKNK